MPTPDDLPPEIRKLVDFVTQQVVAGLQHGFFDIGIKCDTEKKGLREVIVQAGKKHKFNISADQIPK